MPDDGVRSGHGLGGEVRGEQSLPFQRHSETSRAAAEAMRAQVPRLTGDRQRIVNVLLSGGKTDAEIQEILGLRGSTQRPRRVELVEMGVVIDTGLRRDRSTVWGLASMQGGRDAG